MSEKHKFVNWMKIHKTEMIIAGVTIVGTVLVIKNRDAIKEIFNKKKSIIPGLVKIEPVAEEIVVPVIFRDILDNLAGNKLTARALGNRVGYSAQAINKRIVDAGLMQRLPCGKYIMTDAGRLLGKDTWKITAAGYSFSNIEWDEKILEVVFSPEELLEIAAKREGARQILAA